MKRQKENALGFERDALGNKIKRVKAATFSACNSGAEGKTPLPNLPRSDGPPALTRARGDQ